MTATENEARGKKGRKAAIIDRWRGRCDDDGGVLEGKVLLEAAASRSDQEEAAADSLILRSFPPSPFFYKLPLILSLPTTILL